MGLAQRS